MFADNKTTAAPSGTLIYSKLKPNSAGYRVRFRSFQQNMMENK